MREREEKVLPSYQPSCSVVICTRNRPEKLRCCLESTRELDYPNYDIIIVDNGDREQARSVAEEVGATYVFSENPGLSRSRNLGALLSKSEIVAYLDDDAEAEPSWLRELCAEFSDPRVMAAGGQILPLDPQDETEKFWAEIATPGPERQRRWVADPGVKDWFSLTNFGGIADGSNLAIRRTAFDWWSGFDVRLGRGAFINSSEEHYALFQLVHEGYRVTYTPKAVVRHPYPASREAYQSCVREGISMGVAYAIFLGLENPRCWSSLLRHVAGWLRHKPHEWRAKIPEHPQTRISRMQSRIAMLHGVLLYFRSRWQNSARSCAGHTQEEVRTSECPAVSQSATPTPEENPPSSASAVAAQAFP